MNHRMVFSTVGKIVWFEAVLLILPYIVSLVYKETCATAFLITIIIAAIVGTLLILVFKQKDDMIYSKEGFMIVSLSWIVLSLIGALPFRLSGEIPDFVDAVFESVSGLTTTGASVLTDVESMSYGLLFWRSFSQWIGGMGVLVFVIAIIPNVSGRSIHIMRAEVPGPVKGKLVPKMRDTAKILYLIYVVMTIIEIVLLKIGGMNWFESLVHAFATAGTGGFGIKADSLASYSSFIQWVVTIFMILFGVNFNIYFLILVKRFRAIVKSTELWVYLGVIAIGTLCIALNIYPMHDNVSDTIRHAAFQVGATITTTCYVTTDFNLWPMFSKSILFALMLMGGCAGSTSGGFKISRVIILVKKIGSEIKRLLHPRSVKVITVEGKRLDEHTITGTAVYLAVYIICFVVLFLAVSIDNFDFETSFTAVASCFNNIGPGFGEIGPVGNYAEFSVFSKIVLTVSMLLGRLEIFPLIIVAMPATWSKN